MCVSVCVRVCTCLLVCVRVRVCMPASVFCVIDGQIDMSVSGAEPLKGV